MTMRCQLHVKKKKKKSWDFCHSITLVQLYFFTVTNFETIKIRLNFQKENLDTKFEHTLKMISRASTELTLYTLIEQCYNVEPYFFFSNIFVYTLSDFFFTQLFSLPILSGK